LLLRPALCQSLRIAEDDAAWRHNLYCFHGFNGKMKIPPLYRPDGTDPLQKAAVRRVVGEDGQEYIVPRHWGEGAATLLIEKIFCKIPVPPMTEGAAARASDAGIPPALQRYLPQPHAALAPETDFRAAFRRIAGGLACYGWQAGLFDAAEDAENFVHEFASLLLQQRAMPEMALMARAGLDWAYGLESRFTPAARIFAFDDALGAQKLETAAVAVSAGAPQKNMLKRLKHLAAGQALDDASARTAVTLAVENVDSVGFAAVKRAADIEAVEAGLGERILHVALGQVMEACDRDSVFGFDPQHNAKLSAAMAAARGAGVSEAALQLAIGYAQQGYEELPDLARPDDAEALPPIDATLSLPDDFIEKALTGHGFLLSEARRPKKHIAAEKLWNSIAGAIWSSGDPALFFRDSAATASPLPPRAADSNAPPAASLLASEEVFPAGDAGFTFLPNTGAPGGTINLAAFSGGAHIVDTSALSHAVRLLTLALEASYSIADVPLTTLAYRPVSISLQGLSAVLLASALPYDSEEGRAVAGLLTAFVSAAAQESSSALAKTAGAFPAFAAAEKHYLQALKDKMSVLAGTHYMQKGVARRPVQLKPGLSPDPHLPEAVRETLARAYAAGRDKGFRHAHLTAIGADPEMQALLDSAAPAIAPLGPLVRFEGYGRDGADIGVDAAPLYGKTLNPLVPHALQKLGYSAGEIDDINFYAVGHGTLLSAPGIDHAALKRRGFHQAAIDALEAALRTAQHIRYVFNKWTLGEEFCRRVLGLDAVDLAESNFDMLSALGFSEDDIDDANLYACGALTLEGAPHLLPQHAPVFDGLFPGGSGIRRVSAAAQIKMQAAVEAFLSGAVCQTIALPQSATIDEVQKLCLQAWELGVKRLRLYRDGCSLLHPLALEAASAPTASADETAPLALLRRSSAR